MADSTGFSHITVNADADDDVVIQAGIVDRPDDGDAAAAGGEEPVSSDAPEADGAPDDGAQERSTAPSSASRADDGYHETTLADIQDAKMSNTQKAVIIVAALGIIAFVLWYLFAR